MHRRGGGATLRFLGAAGTVTGSKFLIEAVGRRLLLECGLFQGLKPLRVRNWAEPAFDPASLDAVVLSHAHIDHAGYLPLLARRGFRGPVHCTAATASLLDVLLRDAAYLQEEQAAHANAHGYSKHRPALPLFDHADAEVAISLAVPHSYGSAFEAAPGIGALFRRAGHILGAATVEVDLPGEVPVRLVHSGDLGRWDQPILRDPEPVPGADVLLVESTYGDRVHPPEAKGELARIVREAAGRGGALLIPAFAVGRTQTLLWLLRDLESERAIPPLPVFLDSPMAHRVSEIYCRHGEEHDEEMQRRTQARECPLCCRTYTLLRTPEESKSINARHGPFIVIAGSGMVTGGRILHHLERRLSDHRTTVLLVGFQAAGTRGRALQEGARELRLHGRTVEVRARVETIEGLSAHADREGILRWLGGFRSAPRSTWVVHGEEAAVRSLAATIHARLGWDARPAVDGGLVDLAG